MKKTLTYKSDIVIIKSKFFLFRLLTYFSFLLFPIWIQKIGGINIYFKSLLMSIFVGLVAGQWFLLGKEIDHRLKIYFKANSAVDRILYRLLLGMIFMYLFFNLLYFLPGKWIYNCLWVSWALLGIFYSWPTRGKIIEESMTSHFSEFRFLDSFEKTLLGLICLMFLISVPELPSFTNLEALILALDPTEKIGRHFWNFLFVNYYPFYSYPPLFKLGLGLHFYLVGMGLQIMALYAVLRYVVTRRPALLGVFAFVSTWSYSKILVSEQGAAFANLYPILLLWCYLWLLKSSTYRSGLMFGLMAYFGTVINTNSYLLFCLLCFLLFFVSFHDKSVWFKRQLLRYIFFGFVLATAVFIQESNWPIFSFDLSYFSQFSGILAKKGFFHLSYLGPIFLFLIFTRHPFTQNFIFDISILKTITMITMIYLLVAITFDLKLMSNFAQIWPLILLCLLPIEILFQTTGRIRSSRNIIYAIYIVICLLDSHTEGRVKILLRFFAD